jgi:hypothetical protein
MATPSRRPEQLRHIAIFDLGEEQAVLTAGLFSLSAGNLRTTTIASNFTRLKSGSTNSSRRPLGASTTGIFAVFQPLLEVVGDAVE